MRKFFGRVRLLSIFRLKLKRYIFYALGEIVLIVFGILIALQINNWNTLQKERSIGKGYLTRIASDLQKDTLYLNTKIQFAVNEQRAFTQYIKNIYEQQNTVEDFVELTSSVGWNAANLILEDKTYVEITNSGKFSFIEGHQIRDRIMDYYRNYAVKSQHISEMNETGIHMFEDSYKKFVKYYSSLRFLFEEVDQNQYPDWRFINDQGSAEFKELEGVATFYYYKQTVCERYYRELQQEAAQLMRAIAPLALDQ